MSFQLLAWIQADMFRLQEPFRLSFADHVTAHQLLFVLDSSGWRTFVWAHPPDAVALEGGRSSRQVWVYEDTGQ